VNDGVQGWTLGTVWATLKKRWYIIGFTTVLAGLIGMTASFLATPIFHSTATLFVSISQSRSGTDLNQGTTYAHNQMQSFAQLATSSSVLQPVIDNLGLDTTPGQLTRDIQVVNPPDTVILRITASSTAPNDAALIANAVAESLAYIVEEVSPASEEGATSVTASLVDLAVPPIYQTSPNKPRDTLLATAVGFLAGVAAALIYSLLDTRIPNPAVLKEIVTLPVLGSISRVRGNKNGMGLVVAQEPLGPASDEFRRVYSALTFANVSAKLRRILITSTSEREGKSTFAANFALTLAEARNRVLLIDADFRKPRIADVFGIEGSVGLTSVLMGKVTFEQAKMTRSGTSLEILTSGAIPPNPSQMLTSSAMRELLDSVSAKYDYVVIDSPPILSVADANLASPLVDGTIIIIDATRTKRAKLAQSIASFETAGGQITGFVLNKVRRRNVVDDYYYLDSRRGTNSATSDKPSLPPRRGTTGSNGSE